MYITREVADRLLGASQKGVREVRVSLDLNRSEVVLRLAGGVALLPGGGTISLAWLIDAVREGLAYRMEEGRLEALERRSHRYYKIMPTGEAPTLVIDGIQMHQTRWRFPFEESRDKAKQVVRRGDVVLDTCGGLGYTAYWAAKLGAERVISVELDEEVLELRAQNPWIAPDKDTGRVAVVQADVARFIQELAPRSVNAVIHDPPRLSMAGELYGSAFYRELERILIPGGRLFHYVGNPGGKYRGRNIPGGVARRLIEAGFRVEPRDRLLGFVAWKIRS